jgi:tetratricopeptide (TPR) repeat protein
MSVYTEMMTDLAVAKASSGRFAEAAGLLRSILGASGRDAFVLYGIGRMEYRRGNHAAAVELLRESVSMEPANAKAHNDIGLALFGLGDERNAFASLMRACAGALGWPVWLLLANNPVWRWPSGRDDTPWYPTVRPFRQTDTGDWARVVDTVAGELAALRRGEAHSAFG